MCTIQIVRSPYGRTQRPEDLYRNTLAMQRRLRRAQRKLFAEEDTDAAAQGEDSARFLARELAKCVSESNNRWNFDFKTETPLAGRYEWLSADTVVDEVASKKSTQLKITDYMNVRKRTHPDDKNQVRRSGPKNKRELQPDSSKDAAVNS